jgi:DNA-binding protein H-NS
MSDIDLSALSLKDLKKLSKDVEAAIAGYAERQRQDALAKLEEKARELGFSLAELTGAKGRRGKTVAPAKYRDPSDASNTWTGKGRQPEWFKAAVQAGKSPDDMLI